MKTLATVGLLAFLVCVLFVVYYGINSSVQAKLEEVVPVATSNGATLTITGWYIDFDSMEGVIRKCMDGYSGRHKRDILIEYHGQQKEFTTEEFLNKLGFENGN